MIQEPFLFARAIRGKCFSLLDSLTEAQLNTIPKGFRNNIGWHLGHLAVSPEFICYVRTQIDPQRGIKDFKDFGTGSVPKPLITKEELLGLKNRAFAILDKLETDYKNGIFDHIEPYSTGTFVVKVRNPEELFRLCSHHDSWHYGMIMAMKHLV